MRSSPSPSRQIPVKVTTAPTSVRPCVRAAVSSATSKSSRCTLTVTLASRHRREECDLPGAGDRGRVLDMLVVDGSPNNLRVLERIGVVLVLLGQPGDEVGDGGDVWGRRDILLACPDPFPKPREIQDLHDGSSI